MFKLEGPGFNAYVIKENKTLKDICKNDKTFDTDFRAYLKAFDPETTWLDEFFKRETKDILPQLYDDFKRDIKNPNFNS